MWSEVIDMPTCVVKTMADVNKVIEGIIADQAKLHTYCDLADTNGQMVEADQKNQEKVLQELSRQGRPVCRIPLVPRRWN